MNKLFGFFVSLALILLPLASYGQPEAIKSAREAVIETLDKLAAVREQELNPRDKERREFELKKLALNKIADLSLLETEDLETKLEALSEIPAEFLILKDSFLIALANFLEVLSGFKKQLLISNDLATVQNLAGEFKNWREAIYNPEVKKIAALMSVFQNKKLLKVADARFELIAGEIRRLKPAPKSIPENWLALLNQAALKLKSARELNAEAINQLLNYLPVIEETPVDIAEDTPMREPKELKPETEKPEPSAPEAEPTIGELTGQSIAQIREAYQNFIRLNNFIKKSK